LTVNQVIGNHRTQQRPPRLWIDSERIDCSFFKTEQILEHRHTCLLDVADRADSVLGVGAYDALVVVDPNAAVFQVVRQAVRVEIRRSRIVLRLVLVEVGVVNGALCTDGRHCTIVLSSELLNSLGRNPRATNGARGTPL